MRHTMHKVGLVMTMMLMLCVPLRAEFAVPYGVFGNSSAQISGSNNGVIGTLGQASTGLIASATQTHQVGFWATQVAPITLVIPDTTAGYASTVSVPIRVNNDFMTPGVVAIDIAVAYDDRIIQSVVVDTTDALAGGGWIVAQGHPASNASTTVDTLLISMATTTDTLWTKGDLVYLSVTTDKPDSLTFSNLELASVRLNNVVPLTRTLDGSLTLEGTVTPTADAQLEVSYVVQAQNSQSITPRDFISVVIHDADRNLSPSVSDDFGITINGGVYTISETGINTGTFYRQFRTVTSSPNVNDVLVAAWDTVTVTYIDTLNSLSGVDTLTAITRVVDHFGDVDNNNVIQAFDALKVLEFSIGAASATGRDSLVADVDGDGALLALDASLVMQYAVQNFPLVAVTSVQIPDGLFPVQYDSRFFEPADQKNHPVPKPVVLERELALGELVRQKDGTLLMPVHLNERRDIQSGMFKLEYEADLAVMDVATDDAYANYQVIHNANEEDMQIALAGSNAKLEGEGNVFWIRFQPQGDGPFRFVLTPVTLNGTPFENGEIVVEREVISKLPLEFALHPNMPNPFNPQTTIRYDLPEASHVSLAIYNVMGQLVNVLVSERQDAGFYEAVWDGKDALGRSVGSGLYLMHMQAGDFRHTQKMLMLK